MREIVLDTETTGFNADGGDRLVELGCIELVNHIPTGRHLHKYCNPQRDMPEEALKVHGLTEQFLSDKPLFAEIADEFLKFIGEDTKLVIHNAAFDMAFLNAELKRAGRKILPFDRAVDTVQMARRKFPGAQASLDALCKRFNIDNSARIKHGALLDAELLAEVYLELVGGRQQGLGLAGDGDDAAAAAALLAPRGPARPVRPHAALPEELAAHEKFIGKLKEAIWLN